MRDSDPLLAVEDPAVVLLFDTVLSPPKENSLANDNGEINPPTSLVESGASAICTSWVDELGVFAPKFEGPVFVREPAIML